MGGRDAAVVIGELERIGYAGAIWPVNPKRKTLAGRHCFANLNALPDAPDATFLAVPAAAALGVVKELAALKAGGVVCYTAGFSGDGSEGGAGDKRLIAAAGDLALVGPNCYGIINYIDKVALWPFAHGGFCPGYGAAIITQSGMLSSDITMNQRSIPLAYMVSAGNQACLGLEDYLDVLCAKRAVKALGLHLEGLKNIPRFIAAAQKALALNKPIVVLKTGTSAIGARLTVSHTGSLSGAAESYQALFARLGIISVSSPAQLLETLKFICVAGVPKGNKVMGFTCSGGGATLLADHAETIDLEFPQPTAAVREDLATKLPSIAQVSNPLDYTTPIWGDPERLPPVFAAALQDSYDSAVIVQDYPLPALNESKCYYLNDAQSFIDATAKAGLPAAVCSTLPENIDRATRHYLLENGVAPMQGIHETLNAMAGAIQYGAQRRSLLAKPAFKLLALDSGCGTSAQLDEWSSKQALKRAGLAVPLAQLVTLRDLEKHAVALEFPLVLKVNSTKIAHKTELGAIKLNVQNPRELCQAAQIMHDSLKIADAAASTFLVESQLKPPLLELMVSIRADEEFGWLLTLASGGAMVELLQDAQTLILPLEADEIKAALLRLRSAPLLQGFRGAAAVQLDTLSETIMRIAAFAIKAGAMKVEAEAGAEAGAMPLAQLEINPLFVYPDRAVIVDALIHQFTPS